jgi:transcriptional regulator with XRE-family HTH domain
MTRRKVNKNPRRRQDILDEVKAKFSSVIGDQKGKVPVHLAAEKLNVSRQMLHRYITGKAIPRADVLIAAMHEWPTLVITYRGLDVTAGYRQDTDASQRPQPKQLRLFELADEISNRDLEVTVAKTSAEGIELNVRIKFSA